MRKRLHEFGVWASLRGIFCIDDPYVGAQIIWDRTTLEQLIVDGTGKQGEKAMGRKPVGSTPLRPLLRCLPPEFCLEFLPWLPL